MEFNGVDLVPKSFSPKDTVLFWVNFTPHPIPPSNLYFKKKRMKLLLSFLYSPELSLMLLPVRDLRIENHWDLRKSKHLDTFFFGVLQSPECDRSHISDIELALAFWRGWLRKELMFVKCGLIYLRVKEAMMTFRSGRRVTSCGLEAGVSPRCLLCFDHAPRYSRSPGWKRILSFSFHLCFSIISHTLTKPTSSHGWLSKPSLRSYFLSLPPTGKSSLILTL